MSCALHLVHVIDQRVPNVAAGVYTIAIGSGCHLPNQGCSGRLARRAGNADGLAGHHFHEDLCVVRKWNPTLNGLSHNGKRERHPAGKAEHIREVQQLERMAAERPLNWIFRKRLARHAQIFSTTLVAERDLSAVNRKPARQGQSLPGRSQNQHTLARPIRTHRLSNLYSPRSNIE